MARHRLASGTPAKGMASPACFAFVIFMAAAFWAGAFWIGENLLRLLSGGA